MEPLTDPAIRELAAQRARSRPGYYRAKRGLDVAVSGLILFIFAPILIPVTLLIMWDSPGWPFYRSTRYRQGGRPFGLLKLRTLCNNADQMTLQQSLGPNIGRDDPRLTRAGRFLRSSKLNEIPQLWNVFVGDISLVGPRPDLAEHLQMVPTQQRTQILSIPQGIVDFATLRFSDLDSVEAAEVETYHREVVRPEKTRLQLEYLERSSFWVDLQILIELALVLAQKIAKGISRKLG